MDRLHQTSDRQSLALTVAAIDRLRQAPGLVESVMATLDHWDRVSGAASQPLRDEWRRIVMRRDWAAALADDDRGRQLRQASPLGKALPPSERLTIIRQCKGRSSST